MDQRRFHELLALASHHLAEARRVIRLQEQLMSQMLDEGAHTGEAQSLIEKLRASAEAMAEHERSIEQQIRALQSGDGR